MIRLLLGFLALFAPLAAHECWLQPSDFSPAPGRELRLGLRVGMQLKGEPRDFTAKRVAALRHYFTAGVEDWTARATGQPELPFTLATPGTHVLAYDSSASLITLEAEKFHAYLREEGLENIIALREQAGEAAQPGRERYLRCNKTLLQAGASDGTWAARTSQLLEIVPLADPAAVPPGGTLRFLLLLDGQPLAGALLRAWHRTGDQLTTLDARTSASGEAAFTLPAAGMWMISTVHMRRLQGDTEADWESLWGNFTFSLAATPAPAPKAHPVKGVVVSLLPEKTALLVKHEEVPGVMRAMTMMFKVEPAVLERVKPGDALAARMSRRADGWWLHAVEVLPPAK